MTESAEKLYTNYSSLLKELEQYRAIGTVEEFEGYKLGDCMNDCEHYDNCSNYIYSKGYNKAIDEFAERIKQCDVIEYMGSYVSYEEIASFIDEIAEQMKGGATDEWTGSN